MVLPTRPNELPKIKSSRRREAKLELQPGCDRDQGVPDSDLAGGEHLGHLVSLLAILIVRHHGCKRDLGDPGSDLAGCERGQRREVGISFNLPEASKDRASPACCKYVPSPKVIV